MNPLPSSHDDAEITEAERAVAERIARRLNPPDPRSLTVEMLIDAMKALYGEKIEQQIFGDLRLYEKFCEIKVDGRKSFTIPIRTKSNAP